ncbi:hypothetical protein HYH03_017339 [Edaphochlamys debaryana]|uniref:non-specific serine/threonine protein kinase n=1 Tax=Edaphochlamys debaryana TaxID=47281 RepID=A0A835XK94_9CHLO|nr:hypothetical protein HYH03_017339 [Edaphochlamys debaryana]|eukprot:KAG2483816.1 hypothetical protein HYH03_017339 [Edaphochlamys debaryana]
MADENPQDLVARIRVIARVVCDRMGGVFDTESALDHFWQQSSATEKKRNRSAVVCLCRLDTGSSRHRALLYKVLADAAKVPCRVVRGAERCGSDHAANALVTINGQEWVVDLVFEAGRLLSQEDFAALVRLRRQKGDHWMGHSVGTGVVAGGAAALVERSAVSASSTSSTSTAAGGSVHHPGGGGSAFGSQYGSAYGSQYGSQYGAASTAVSAQSAPMPLPAQPAGGAGANGDGVSGMSPSASTGALNSPRGTHTHPLPLPRPPAVPGPAAAGPTGGLVGSNAPPSALGLTASSTLGHHKAEPPAIAGSRVRFTITDLPKSGSQPNPSQVRAGPTGGPAVPPVVSVPPGALRIPSAPHAAQGHRPNVPTPKGTAPPSAPTTSSGAAQVTGAGVPPPIVTGPGGRAGAYATLPPSKARSMLDLAGSHSADTPKSSSSGGGDLIRLDSEPLMGEYAAGLPPPESCPTPTGAAAVAPAAVHRNQVSLDQFGWVKFSGSFARPAGSAPGLGAALGAGPSPLSHASGPEISAPLANGSRLGPPEPSLSQPLTQPDSSGSVHSGSACAPATSDPNSGRVTSSALTSNSGPNVISTSLGSSAAATAGASGPSCAPPAAVSAVTAASPFAHYLLPPGLAGVAPAPPGAGGSAGGGSAGTSTASLVGNASTLSMPSSGHAGPAQAQAGQAQAQGHPALPSHLPHPQHPSQLGQQQPQLQPQQAQHAHQQGQAQRGGMPQHSTLSTASAFQAMQLGGGSAFAAQQGHAQRPSLPHQLATAFPSMPPQQPYPGSVITTGHHPGSVSPTMGMGGGGAFAGHTGVGMAQPMPLPRMGSGSYLGPPMQPQLMHPGMTRPSNTVSTGAVPLYGTPPAHQRGPGSSLDGTAGPGTGGASKVPSPALSTPFAATASSAQSTPPGSGQPVGSVPFADLSPFNFGDAAGASASAAANAIAQAGGSNPGVGSSSSAGGANGAKATMREEKERAQAAKATFFADLSPFNAGGGNGTGGGNATGSGEARDNTPPGDRRGATYYPQGHSHLTHVHANSQPVINQSQPIVEIPSSDNSRDATPRVSFSSMADQGPSGGGAQGPSSGGMEVMTLELARTRLGSGHTAMRPDGAGAVSVGRVASSQAMVPQHQQQPGTITIPHHHAHSRSHPPMALGGPNGPMVLGPHLEAASQQQQQQQQQAAMLAAYYMQQAHPHAAAYLQQQWQQQQQQLAGLAAGGYGAPLALGPGGPMSGPQQGGYLPLAVPQMPNHQQQQPWAPGWPNQAPRQQPGMPMQGQIHGQMQGQMQGSPYTVQSAFMQQQQQHQQQQLRQMAGMQGQGQGVTSLVSTTTTSTTVIHHAMSLSGAGAGPAGALSGPSGPQLGLAGPQARPQLPAPPGMVDIAHEKTMPSSARLAALQASAAAALADGGGSVSGGGAADASGSGLLLQPTLSASMPLPPSYKELEIDPGELTFGPRIGIGSYGEVYKGTWRGTEVAIKRFLEQNLSPTLIKEFRDEVMIMSKLRHPNIVLFMGAVTCTNQLAIVSQFVQRGSLFRLLHRTKAELDPRRRLGMAMDIAKGMEYLHNCKPVLVHRDLKSPNLLVDRDWTVKVCDFGLSQVKMNTFLTAKSQGGSPAWMAPEILRNERCDEKSDVFSFGVILYELVTGREPWESLNPMQVVGVVGFNGQRMDLPSDLDPAVNALIQACWADKPTERPSFSQVLATLQGWTELRPTAEVMKQQADAARARQAKAAAAAGGGA